MPAQPRAPDASSRRASPLQEDGVAVTPGAYSRLVAVLSKAGQWRRCLEAVRWMRAEGLRPDTVTCADLISCLSAAGKWDAAMEELRAIMASDPAEGAEPGGARQRQVKKLCSAKLRADLGRQRVCIQIGAC